jgi:hypothetical protein
MRLDWSVDVHILSDYLDIVAEVAHRRAHNRLTGKAAELMRFETEPEHTATTPAFIFNLVLIT